MKVALIGATGFVGSAVLKELLQRGHEVVALVRDPAKLAAQPRLQAVQADVLDAAAVQRAVAGADAVVSAYNAGWGNPDIYEDFMRGSRAILAGTKGAGIQRHPVGGGAGRPHLPPRKQPGDTPAVPPPPKPAP